MESRSYADPPKVSDDRTATEKASGVAGKMSNLLARANDLNARLGRVSDTRPVEIGYGGEAPPRPMGLLHESLDEASLLADRINDVLDKIERRL